MKLPDYLLVTCQECGHSGPVAVPVTVETLYCLICGWTCETPRDFLKHDATYTQRQAFRDRSAQLREAVSS